MDKSTISIGAKNPKKEIDVQLTKGKIFLLFLVLMFIVFAVHTVLVKSDLVEKELAFTCSNGDKENIEKGKQFYCEGVHYSEVRDYVSEESYKKIEEIIFEK